MDTYTVGILLRQILESAGLKATIAIVCVVGFLLGIYKAVSSLARFFERLIENRDSMLAQLTRDIKASDERRAIHEVKLAEVMARMGATTEGQLNEARETRKEMHQRFNKVQEDVTTIKGAVS